MAIDQGAQNAEIVRAARRLGQEFHSYTLTDLGPALTCTESDALSELLRALGLQNHAETLEAAHAADDEEGDAHWEGDNE